MPGLSLICDFRHGVANDLTEHLRREHETHPEEYSTSVLWQDQHIALLSSGYPEYPIAVHETPHHRIAIEGFLYRPSESPWYRSLLTSATNIFCGDPHGIPQAARWIEETDGDFVVVMQDRRSGDVLVFNDILGRLPLYVHRQDLTFVISRNVAFVIRAAGNTKFDRFAIADCLAYGYPLGSRTLFHGVERVSGAAMVQIRKQAREATLRSLLLPSVAPGREELSASGLRHMAKELSAGFVGATAGRVARAGTTIVGLSGGLDSRAVAAAVSVNRLPFRAVTRRMTADDVEVRIAAKVASVLTLNWRAVQISRPTGSDLLRLLKLKSGMNHLGMAFILPFFDMLQAEFGRGMAYLTGDGGDKILPDQRPKVKVQNSDALMRYILANHEIFPLDAVVSFTGVSRLDILSGLEARILSYPEDRLEDKYVHFVLFERGFKWLFEGEDRNRHFFWSATPFYGRQPFECAMRCHGQFKANYELYRRFIESLNPKLVDVESTTCGPSLHLWRHPMHRLSAGMRQWAPMRIRRGLRALRTPGAPSEVVTCVREQLGSATPVPDYLSVSYGRAGLGQVGRTQSYVLLTLTSAIEYLTTGSSTLERYRDIPFR